MIFILLRKIYLIMTFLFSYFHKDKPALMKKRNKKQNASCSVFLSSCNRISFHSNMLKAKAAGQPSTNNRQLKMNNLAVGCCRCFHDRLAHSRVRVNGFDDFVTGSFEFTGGYDFGNHFSDIRAYHVRA